MIRIEENKTVKIGDTVYILGAYVPCGEVSVVEAVIDHIKHRQFAAFKVDGPGTWYFSHRHIGKTVFLTREDAEAALREA